MSGHGDAELRHRKPPADRGNDSSQLLGGAVRRHRWNWNKYLAMQSYIRLHVREAHRRSWAECNRGRHFIWADRRQWRNPTLYPRHHGLYRGLRRWWRRNYHRVRNSQYRPQVHGRYGNREFEHNGQWDSRLYHPTLRVKWRCKRDLPDDARKHLRRIVLRWSDTVPRQPCRVS